MSSTTHSGMYRCSNNKTVQRDFKELAYLLSLITLKIHVGVSKIAPCYNLYIANKSTDNDHVRHNGMIAASVIHE